METQHEEDNLTPEIKEYQNALEFLRRPEFEFKGLSGRLPLRKLWIPIYLTTLVILFFLFFIQLTSSFPIPRQRWIYVGALAVLAVVFIAPLIASFITPLVRYIGGEQIEQANYKDRLAHDLENAKLLREKLNSNNKLKILAAHVKRDADKTSDRINFLSQALLLSGLLMAGAMLAFNESDGKEQITVITAVAAAITFFVRGFAVMKLSTLRDWLSVIEQAQNLDNVEVAKGQS